MKVTFPHMGNLEIIAKTFLTEMGVDCIIPPPITRRTLNLGVEYSPEFACLPLKINVGNFIEAAEEGADLVIMGGGVGPCRFGYYAEVEREILQDMGIPLKMVVIDPPLLHPIELIKKIRRIVGPKPYQQIVRAFQLAWAKAGALDSIEKLTYKIRPRAVKREQVTPIYRKAQKALEEAVTFTEIHSVTSHFIGLLEALPQRPDWHPPKIGVVGEIYVLLEPRVNLFVEEKLGLLGAEVERSIFLTDCIKEEIFAFFHRGERNKIAKAARGYLDHFVGGHGLTTIGKAVLFARDRFDGLVQVYPFTCMPEIVAQSILPRIGRDFDIPVLTLVIDEHSAEAGVITRLEAFVDLILRKKSYKKGEFHCKDTWASMSAR